MAVHVEDTEKPETATVVNDVKLDSIGLKQEELVSAAQNGCRRRGQYEHMGGIQTLSESYGLVDFVVNRCGYGR